MLSALDLSCISGNAVDGAGCARATGRRYVSKSEKVPRITPTKIAISMLDSGCSSFIT
jgi:hypothetical protein